MKYLIIRPPKLLPILFVTIALFVASCTTSQQQTAFNTIYSVEHSTVTAYDAYIGLVIAGQVKTNGLPEISQAFNTFQAADLLALDAVQYSTNALAPASLITYSQDVLNLINQAKGK